MRRRVMPEESERDWTGRFETEFAAAIPAAAAEPGPHPGERRDREAAVEVAPKCREAYGTICPCAVGPEDPGFDDLGVAPNDVLVGQVEGEPQVTTAVDRDDGTRHFEDSGSPRPFGIGSHGRNVPRWNLFPVERLRRARLGTAGLVAFAGVDP
jgi:hypothetical protein